MQGPSAEGKREESGGRLSEKGRGEGHQRRAPWVCPKEQALLGLATSSSVLRVSRAREVEGVEKEVKDEKGKIINMKTITVTNGELGELV